MYYKLFLMTLCLVAGWSSSSDAASAVAINDNTIPVHYHLMDQGTFQRLVVGNTIVGVTSRSKSLYLLYFAKDGYCELWKQYQVYAGNWWVEKDELGRDFMRAFWPEYSSYDKTHTATSAWYYVDTKQPDTLLVATKTDRSPVLLVPGRAFPTH